MSDGARNPRCDGAQGGASDDVDPSTRRIAIEIALFAALFVVAGGIFVLFRVLQRGPEVLDLDPHAAERARDDR